MTLNKSRVQRGCMIYISYVVYTYHTITIDTFSSKFSLNYKKFSPTLYYMVRTYMHAKIYYREIYFLLNVRIITIIKYANIMTLRFINYNKRCYYSIILWYRRRGGAKKPALDNLVENKSKGHKLPGTQHVTVKLR